MNRTYLLGGMILCGPPPRGQPVGTRLGSASLQAADHLVELLQAAIANVDEAALAAMIDRHREAECVRQAFLQSKRVGILEGALARSQSLALGLGALLRQRLDLAHIEPALH